MRGRLIEDAIHLVFRGYRYLDLAECSHILEIEIDSCDLLLQQLCLKVKLVHLSFHVLFNSSVAILFSVVNSHHSVF